MDTIKTVFHAYKFDISNPAEREAYREFCAARAAEGRRVFKTHGNGSHWLPVYDGLTVELETAHVFDNQWNTAPVGESKNGLRVFDWAEDALWSNGRENVTCRRGHWLELTDAMRELRAQVVKCGYCGAQYGPDRKPIPADGFCTKCIASEYLEEKELPLLRLLPAGSKFGTKRAPLTDAERAILLPAYREAQTTGRNVRDAEAEKIARERIAKRRAETIATAERKKANADTVRDIELWTLENLGYKYLGNVIFYDHTGRASFGWCKPLTAEQLSHVLDKISEFRWPYDIKCADGRTLSGER